MFKSKYIDDFKNDSLTNPEVLILSIEVLKELNWSIVFYNEFEIVAHSGFSMSSWGERIHIKITDSKILFRSECTGTQLFDWGKNKKNFRNFYYLFEQKKETFKTSDIESTYNEIKKEFTYSNKNHSQTSILSDISSLLKPVEGYYITPILIGINILFFLLMVLTGASILSPDSKFLLFWGANFRPYTIDGEWWRLLTSCFLHIGILHLFFNVFALAYVGKELEHLIGKVRFLTAFLLTGILGSLTSIYWHELTISAGASGAIFGLFGVLLITVITNKRNRPIRQSILPSLLAFIILNLILGNRDGIDNAAHIGGLIGGIFIGIIYSLTLRFNKSKKSLIATITVLSLGVMSLIIYMSSFINFNDNIKYELDLVKLIKKESKIIAIANNPNAFSHDTFWQEIRTTVIPACKSNIELLESFEELDLSDSVVDLNLKRKHYYQMRLKQFELSYNDMLNNTNINRPEIKNLGEKATDLKSKIYIRKK